MEISPQICLTVELTIQSAPSQPTSAARFMLHALQLVPKKSQKSKIAYGMFLGRGSYSDPEADPQMIKKRFAVVGGLNLELALAQFWSGLGSHNVDISLNFHGIQLAGNLSDGTGTITLSPQITRLDLQAPIRREEEAEINVSFGECHKRKSLQSVSLLTDLYCRYFAQARSAYFRYHCAS
jgi:tripeptidyl-peptidase-2